MAPKGRNVVGINRLAVCAKGDGVQAAQIDLCVLQI